MRLRALAAIVLLQEAVAAPVDAQWTPLTSGTSVSLRGLSVVDDRTAWASGQRGTVIRTTDGGASWTVLAVSGAEGFDLRAIHARSAGTAHVAATAGRIFRTTDGGANWTLTWQAADTSVFLDAIDFWDDRRGMALGDPMGGRFLVLETLDGGATWNEASSRPGAEQGEAAFAASGSVLVLTPGGRAWIGSGGRVARLHTSADWGRTWQVADTPMLQGTSSRGIFGMAVPAAGSALLVGGDYLQPDTTRGNAAATADGQGLTTHSSRPRGFREGVALFSRGRAPAVAIAVGPSGSDISRDHGVTWAAFDSAGFHAVRASGNGVFFAAGGGGRVARFDARAPR